MENKAKNMYEVISGPGGDEKEMGAIFICVDMSIVINNGEQSEKYGGGQRC